MKKNIQYMVNHNHTMKLTIDPNKPGEEKTSLMIPKTCVVAGTHVCIRRFELVNGKMRTTVHT